MAEETKKAEQAETPETEKETVAKETQAQEETVEETPAKAEEKKVKKKSKKKDKKDEIVDNFERGLAAVPEEEQDNAFVKGMEAVYKQFTTVLEEIGVTPIEAVGKEFDPNLHNAVMHDEDETKEANIISEEFQKGYMYKDSVVRHSMVKVVN